MANSFSADQFRKKALLCQGLLRRGSFGRGSGGVHSCIRQLGYVQIDTISVVERAHHHVLWSRVPGYRPSLLDDLVRTKKVFEYWFHAASYLPVEDYRFALPRMHAIKSGEKHWFAGKDKRLMKRILKRLEDEGPLMARDFEDRRQSKSGWWDWKPAKQALEQLFMEGDIMVVARQGFQKIYDLTDRVLPASVNTVLPDTHDQAGYLIDTTIRAHGFAALKSFTYLRKGKSLRDSVREQLEQRVADKRLIKTMLPCETQVYANPELSSRKRISDSILILSPFDNCLIQRERCRRVFDFDYQIECYVPSAKRHYGYFCLPLLHGDRFVGQVDCKVDRKAGLLDIKSLHLSDTGSHAVYEKLSEAFQSYAEFNSCTDIRLSCNAASSRPLAALL